MIEEAQLWGAPGDMDAGATLFSRVGVLTGLDFEARLITRVADSAGGKTHFRALATGAGADGILRATRKLIDDGAEALVSFGVCGALSPALSCGDVVLASTVYTREGRFTLDYGIRNRLAAGFDDDLAISEGPICATRHILMTPAEKTREFRETGAIAVDMESGIICREASAAGIPCAVLRVVADAAADRIPQCAAEGFGADGRVRAGSVIASLARHPAEMADLLRFTRRVWQARRRLRSIARPLVVLLAGV